MQNSFKRNLIIGYCITIVLLVATAAASYISIRNLLANQQKVNKTNTFIAKLQAVLGIIIDAETGQRGYLLTNDRHFLEPFTGADDRLNLVFNELVSLTADNPVQRQSVLELKVVMLSRYQALKARIDDKRRGIEPTAELLTNGKQLMDNTRNLIAAMSQRERAQLINQTQQMNRFAAATPAFILIASLLSVVVTVVSFYRVTNDFNKRTALQKELQQKDEQILKRLQVIKSIAERISQGDYKTRVSDEGQDVLGSLSDSLNKMAESLDFAFGNLSLKEWMQTGIAALNERMIEEKRIDALTYNIVEFLAGYTNSQVAAFYVYSSEDKLILTATVGLNRAKLANTLLPGEGMAGRAAANGQPVWLDGLENSALTIDFTSASVKPASVAVIPVFYERSLKGVIELASLKNYSESVREFLQTAAFNIGMALNSAASHLRLQELLAETQAQAEELQAQHAELENINAELEAQAEKLQVTDEELRVQQEELQQSNQELEERSRLLEEKNEMILERNLDIQRKVEELALSTKYKSEFLANMSHELRTPLNSILLLSRLLAENHGQNLLDEQVEYANVIQSSGKGLLTLIDEILDLSKIESGKMELQLDNVQVQQIADQLKAMFLPMAHDKGIAFNLVINSNFPAAIKTDVLRLEQILRNLLSNALKFTKKGSVTLTFSHHGNTLAFAVADTGIGIPNSKQQTIFEAFQQADGSTRRQYGGTGLGLSISRELAKLLGGSIVLESKEGEGSTFTLLLPENGAPLQPPAQIAAPLPANSFSQTSAAAKEVNEYLSTVIPQSLADDRNDIAPGDRVLLIIEDDTNFAGFLLNYTRNSGYKALVAVRGDEGVLLARNFKPLGILLDVQLPVKSGWEVMDELKADSETRHIPVHMMSSHQVKIKSLSAGAVDFIDKPVVFEKLAGVFKKIEQALTRNPKKVLIVEENTRHAEALAYYLESFHVNAAIQSTVNDSISALNRNEIDCVILDMDMPAEHSYQTLEAFRKTEGFENLPIIIFTGKNLSAVEEMKIRKYADSIVIKTANSYQRILDEVTLFLHLVEQNRPAEKASRYSKSGTLSEVLQNKTVLVADDDVRNIFSLTKSLEGHGINVVSAVDGKEALEKLEQYAHVDLVLMDMMMPEMDGYESIARIRRKPGYQQLPIIAVTAKAMTGDREKCINAGASDYITKPVDVDQLISLLRVWLYAQ